jgi:hypothetical protein
VPSEITFLVQISRMYIKNKKVGAMVSKSSTDTKIQLCKFNSLSQNFLKYVFFKFESKLKIEKRQISTKFNKKMSIQSL